MLIFLVILIVEKNTIGFVFTLDGTTISWVSNLQKIAALFTIEAEYVARIKTRKEMILVHRFLDELGKKQELGILHNDSQSEIFLAKNLVFYSKSKHIQMRYHFIRYLVEDELVILKKIWESKNLVDMLTKGVTIERLKLCTVSISLLAWGQENELQWWWIVFKGLRFMLVIKLVSKWEICWAFVEPSCVWSGLWLASK